MKHSRRHSSRRHSSRRHKKGGDSTDNFVDNTIDTTSNVVSNAWSGITGFFTGKPKQSMGGAKRMSRKMKRGGYSVYDSTNYNNQPLQYGDYPQSVTNNQPFSQQQNGGKRRHRKSSRQTKKMRGGEVPLPYSEHVWSEQGAFPAAVGGKSKRRRH
jgi:hypothetical protein